MADLTRVELQRLARLGAKARLEELRLEEAAIRKAFPDLVGARVRQAVRKRVAPRRRRRMSADARRAVSVRMTKYWAAKRKAKAKGAGAK